MLKTLIKSNEEYNLSEDKNLVNELRAKKYVIGEHHFDDIISEKNKLNNFVKKKIKFKKKSSNLKKSKLIQEKNISKGISWKNNDFKKFEILRFLVVEEQSFSQESLFNFIFKVVSFSFKTFLIHKFLSLSERNSTQIKYNPLKSKGIE